MTVAGTDDIDLSANEFWALPLAERAAAFARLRSEPLPRFFAEPEVPLAYGTRSGMPVPPEFRGPAAHRRWRRAIKTIPGAVRDGARFWTIRADLYETWLACQRLTPAPSTAAQATTREPWSTSAALSAAGLRPTVGR